jgi:hypothetical protein
MPSVIGAWCRQQGHRVHYILYGGRTNILKQIPDNLDLVMISSFTFTAHLAYALSNMLRSKGIVTILGGPHARCYPEDSSKYFDYVIGMINKELLIDILNGCLQYNSSGIYLSSDKHPKSIPSVEERWDFIEKGYYHSPVVKLIPMLSSLGCPYKCDFCMDSSVPYEEISIDSIKQDLQFALRKFKRPRIGWYDPNFGVRFNHIIDAIEESVPKNSIDFIAECNLSTLSESNVQRLKKNGFITILPGIESWNGYGNKVGTGGIEGYEKVRLVSEKMNMVQRNIPLVNANFLFGLDTDQGSDPFELTKRFLDLTPGIYPVFVLLGVFGRAPEANIQYQRENRLIPIPFHVHRSVHFINIKPKHYTWLEFYDYLIDLLKYAFSERALYRRFMAMKSRVPRWLILAQSISTGGYGKIAYHTEIAKRLRTDAQFRRFFEQETLEIPQFFKEKVKRDLGPLWSWFPKGALEHDPNAYLNSIG